ncbi:hypothetical protein LCGC14_0607790 [marine sediment metagenome]|uniref:Uncharacterized protein n=1 Tax=marine sediment metagenome TaxID=412755 RepID=A0A0F9RSS7_9ZZZZ
MALAEYLLINLGDMATHLGWNAGTPEMAQTVEDTLAALELATEAESTDEVALKAVGRYILWVNVANSLAIQIDFKADRGEFKRSQMFKNVQELIQVHKKAAFPYLSPAVMGEITHSEDPYKETDLTEFG